MKKKLLAMLMSIFMLCTALPFSAIAVNNKKENTIILTIGSNKIELFGSIVEYDVAPRIVNDRTMLPVRIVAENLGAVVLWNSSIPDIVTIKKNDNVIIIKANSKTASVNNSDVLLDSPAFIDDDRMFVPIRFVTQALDAKIRYIDKAEQVIITKQNENFSHNDYSDKNNWAYLENDITSKKADVFFVCPTVYMGTDTEFNMSMSDTDTKAAFLGAINMEKGIYDSQGRLFAPYYRQAGLNAYSNSTDENEQYFELAYNDISDAFQYYLENYNSSRPIILAGFSQGADMCIRLLKEYFDDEKYNKLLVACYAIGWHVTNEEITEYPWLNFAQGETDTGVIVAFNSEAENVDDSMLIPKGTKTLAINPLNWKTDGTKADKFLNLGACFTNYDGNITKEIPALTGAYIDDVRGALKVTDVASSDYPPILDIFNDGVYHLYDYEFFYRNLQKNVGDRLNAYISATGNTGNNEVLKAPNTTDDMFSADFWLDKRKNTDETLMTPVEIAKLNKDIISTKETHTYDLAEESETFDGIILKAAVIKDIDYIASIENYINGKLVSEEYFNNIKSNLPDDSKLSKSMQKKYGYCVNRTVMKSIPYSDFLSDSSTDPEWDNWVLSPVAVNEPIVSYVTTEDGKFTYIKSTCCMGWVPSENIALCSDKAQWKTYLNPKDFLVVTGEKVYLEESIDADLSGKMLTMGTVLPLATENIERVTYRLPWNNYVVKMPAREKNGNFIQKNALIPINRDVNIGFLPYTQENVLKQAFKMLGNRYGWGGMLNACDCSSFAKDIYKCFGLNIARNTTWQAAMPVTQISLENMSDDEKKLQLDKTPLGAILQFNGHEMIYIGENNGLYYTINDVSSLVDPTKPDNGIIRPRSVIVNDLSTLRANKTTWLNNLNNIIIIER